MSTPTDRPASRKPSPARMREINETLRYTMWSVFEVTEGIGDADRAAMVAEVEALVADLESGDVVVRGFY